MRVSPRVQRKCITVGVTSLGGAADKEVLSLLEADPECTVIRDSGYPQIPAAPPFKTPPDLIVVDTGSTSQSSLVEILGDLTTLPSGLLVIAPDERFAVEAYQLRVCGYVTKPLVPEKFSDALEWAKIQIRRKEIEQRNEHPPERLMVKSRNHIHLIRIDDIDWIEANAGHSWIHAQGKKYLLRGKMKCLEESLPYNRFVRIHRSLIVNVDRIRELQQIARGEYHAILGDGTTLAVSRSYRSKLFSVFVKAS